MSEANIEDGLLVVYYLWRNRAFFRSQIECVIKFYRFFIDILRFTHTNIYDSSTKRILKKIADNIIIYKAIVRNWNEWLRHSICTQFELACVFINTKSILAIWRIFDKKRCFVIKSFAKHWGKIKMWYARGNDNITTIINNTRETVDNIDGYKLFGMWDKPHAPSGFH